MRIQTNSVISSNKNECEFFVQNFGIAAFTFTLATYEQLNKCDMTGGMRGALQDIVMLEQSQAEYVSNQAVAWCAACEKLIYEESVI